MALQQWLYSKARFMLSFAVTVYIEFRLATILWQVCQNLP